MRRSLPLLTQLSALFGWRDAMKKGRSIALIDATLTAVFNVFITGVFYTGFLSMYQIDLVSVSIITFIPPLANCFFMFSPLVLERFKRRKWILAAAKIQFYLTYIVAMSLMPLLVHDPRGRVVCFAALQFVSHAVYALFSAGFTPWFYNFYPGERTLRAAYISYTQIIPSMLSGLTMLLCGVVMGLMGAEAQNTFIRVMRYVAFGLVVVDVGFQCCAKEFPYPIRRERIRLREVFTLSAKHKKFMACLTVMFLWSFVANLNSAQWNYFLLNTVEMPYATITTVAAFAPVMMLLFTPLWRKAVNRLSWVRAFALSNLIWAPSELYFFFLSPVTRGMYAPGQIFQQILSVGVNLSYANIFYMNLPKENAATHTCFQLVMCNVCSFLGIMASTLMCSLIGDRVLMIGSIPITSVQWTTVARCISLFAMGIWLWRGWKRFTPDSEIEAVETVARVRKMRS